MARDGEEFPSDNEHEERTRDRVVPETMYSVVRSTIFVMYRDKKHMIVNTLLKELELKCSMRSTNWSWSRATLHRVLTVNMPFTYRTRPNHCKTLKEKQSVAFQRMQYLKHVRWYRKEGRPIFY
jgi:hypothetical protein